jgi:predicted double-glycine peptidase
MAVLSLYGKTAAVRELHIDTTVMHGTSPASIAACLISRGVKAAVVHRPAAADVRQLIDRGRPVIWDMRAYGGEHWVVCCGYDAERLSVADPMCGLAFVPWPDFSRRSGGVAVVPRYAPRRSRCRQPTCAVVSE